MPQPALARPAALAPAGAVQPSRRAPAVDPAAWHGAGRSRPEGARAQVSGRKRQVSGWSAAGLHTLAAIVGLLVSGWFAPAGPATPAHSELSSSAFLWYRPPVAQVAGSGEALETGRRLDCDLGRPDLATAGRCRCSGGVHKATRSCSSGRDPGRGRPTVFGRRLRFAAGDRDPPPNTNAAQCHGVRVGCISQRSIKCWGFGARLTIEAGVHHSRLALGAQHSRAADRADSATMCLPLHALIIDPQNCPALHRHPGTTD